MTLFKRYSQYFILSFLWILIISSCATTSQKKSPSSTDNTFEFGSFVKTITLLPVVNNRKGDTDVEDYYKLSKDIETELFFKGYDVQIASDFGPNMEFTSDEIISMEVGDLAELGPPDSKYLFLFFLIDSTYTNAVIATSSDVEAKGRLIDKQEKRLLWEGGCSESMTALGLGETLVTPVKGLSMRKCFLKMFSEFPHRSD